MGQLGRRVLAVACWALVGSFTCATTFYVDPAGDDGGPGSEASPFATPQGCVDKMNGGDTCLIKNGTYVTSSTSNTRPAYNFCERAINGSPGAYTTIKNYPGHTPLIRSTENSAIGVQALAGICEYFHFEGLKIEGGLMIRSPGDYDTRHITVRGNEITGGFDCDGNWSIVRIEDVQSVTFDHNHIHAYDSTACTDEGGTASSSMVKIFCARDSLFEFNTLDASDSVGGNPRHGFDDKDTALNNTYRYNRIAAGGREGIRIGHQKTCGPLSRDLFVYGNLFENSGFRGLRDTENVQLYGNTFANTTGINVGAGCDGDGMIGVVVRDNLLDTVQLTDPGRLNWLVAFGNWDELLDNWIIDYNIYDPAGKFRSKAFGPGDTTHPEQSGWQAAGGIDQHSVESVCEFSEDGDYNVVGGACLTASTSGGQVGAYGLTSCVGHECAPGVGQPSTCGDSTAEATEVCDGDDLRGATCESQGYVSGELGCAYHCAGFDTSGCSETISAESCGGLETACADEPGIPRDPVDPLPAGG